MGVTCLAHWLAPQAGTGSTPDTWVTSFHWIMKVNIMVSCFLCFLSPSHVLLELPDQFLFCPFLSAFFQSVYFSFLPLFLGLALESYFNRMCRRRFLFYIYYSHVTSTIAPYGKCCSSCSHTLDIHACSVYYTSVCTFSYMAHSMVYNVVWYTANKYYICAYISVTLYTLSNNVHYK